MKPRDFVLHQVFLQDLANTPDPLTEQQRKELRTIAHDIRALADVCEALETAFREIHREP